MYDSYQYRKNPRPRSCFIHRTDIALVIKTINVAS
jgi:hypothetical protein